MKQQQWPCDRVERRALATLFPDARNARQHSDQQVAQIAASIREWGWTMPVLIDESSSIIAGHGRVMAARQLGLQDVPVMIAAGWTDAQKRAYIIADNQLTLNASWDLKLLSSELLGLQEWNFDLALTGFSEEELAGLLDKNTGLTDPDATPDPPAQPVSVPGDLWHLGRHRLCCGDATNAKDVQTSLDGVQPHLMVTDPPYGVDYDPAWREGADLQVGKRSKGLVVNDDRADWSEAWQLFKGQIAYVWHGGLHSAVVEQSLRDNGFALRAQIIWVKQHFVMSRGDYHWQHEPCWYAVRTKGQWAGDRKQTTVWQIKNNNIFGGNRGDDGLEKKWGHGTQKPVECMKRPIENNSSPGQAVYDPFAGTGTTIIAAEMTGRSCHAIEINPAYVDVAIVRWQDFTGLEATHADGRTFTAIAAERLARAA